MYAFIINRVTHFTLTRQNRSLCNLNTQGAVELGRRNGPICLECCRLEAEAWVAAWHQKYGVLGPITPIGAPAPDDVQSYPPSRWLPNAYLVSSP